MRYLFVGFLFAFSVSAELSAQSDEAMSELDTFNRRLAVEGDIAAEIGEMFARDQHARFLIIDVIRSNSLSPDDMAWFQAAAGSEIDAIDRANTQRLKAILEQHSWADLAAMRGRTAANAWKIAQHATHDPSFQQSVLDEIAPLVQAGELPGSAYAQLFDRLALADGAPQRFGTQLYCVANNWTPSNLDAEEEVDVRRAEYALPSMAEYLEQHISLYGNCHSEQ